jgi:CheY-like chemotaxis protein
MGERILREEGYEVVSVTDGSTAIIRWKDFNPDLVIADISLPSKTGYDICREIKCDSNQRFTKVILTAGLLETFDHDQAREAGSDGVLRKPFEASSMLETVQTLIEASQFARKMFPREAEPEPEQAVEPVEEPEPAQETINVIHFPAAQLQPSEVQPAQPKVDAGLVRAAVALALEAVLPKLLDEITEHVTRSLEEDAGKSVKEK